jgi:hypothetical protein
MLVFSSRMTMHSVIAMTVDMRRGWPARHPSPQNSSAPRIATTASFPWSETNGDLDLAFLDVEYGIRWIALREDDLTLAIFGYGSFLANFGEEGFRIERWSSSGRHSRRPRQEHRTSSTQSAWSARLATSRQTLRVSLAEINVQVQASVPAPVLVCSTVQEPRQPVVAARNRASGATIRPPPGSRLGPVLPDRRPLPSAARSAARAQSAAHAPRARREGPRGHRAAKQRDGTCHILPLCTLKSYFRRPPKIVKQPCAWGRVAHGLGEPFAC